MARKPQFRVSLDESVEAVVKAYAKDAGTEDHSRWVSDQLRCHFIAQGWMTVAGKLVAPEMTSPAPCPASGRPPPSS